MSTRALMEGRGSLRKARRGDGRPTLVICRTVIGWGAPNKQGSADCHGAPLGADEVARFCDVAS